MDILNRHIIFLCVLKLFISEHSHIRKRRIAQITPPHTYMHVYMYVCDLVKDEINLFFFLLLSLFFFIFVYRYASCFCFCFCFRILSRFHASVGVGFIKLTWAESRGYGLGSFSEYSIFLMLRSEGFCSLLILGHSSTYLQSWF